MFIRIVHNPWALPAWPRAASCCGLTCLATILCAALAAEGLRGAEQPADPLHTDKATSKASSRQISAEAVVPAKVHRYARRLIERYDRNRDGKLQEDEWRRMHGQPARADASGDGVIALDELVQWIVAYGTQHRLRLPYPVFASTAETASADEPGADKSDKEVTSETGVQKAPSEKAEPADDAGPAPEKGEKPDSEAKRRDARFHVSAKRLPAGLPDWFMRRDTDGDGQLTLSEFAPRATAADRQEFAKYDLSGDGVITPQEYLKAIRPAKKTKGVGP